MFRNSNFESKLHALKSIMFSNILILKVIDQRQTQCNICMYMYLIGIPKTSNLTKHQVKGLPKIVIHPMYMYMILDYVNKDYRLSLPHVSLSLPHVLLSCVLHRWSVHQ